MTENLLAFADQQFWMAEEVNGHGITRKDILRQVEKSTGRRADEDREQISCPGGLRHVWDWFLTLLTAYDASVNGLQSGPAKWQADIAALIGTEPRAFEMQIVMRLVTLWRQKRQEIETGSR